MIVEDLVEELVEGLAFPVVGDGESPPAAGSGSFIETETGGVIETETGGDIEIET